MMSFMRDPYYRFLMGGFLTGYLSLRIKISHYIKHFKYVFFLWIDDFLATVN